MITIRSQKDDSGKKKAYFEYMYELESENTGESIIIEPILGIDSNAEARAKAELLDGGFRKRFISFVSYRTDLVLNQIISVAGSKFKIIGMNINIGKVSAKITYKGLRYES